MSIRAFIASSATATWATALLAGLLTIPALATRAETAAQRKADRVIELDRRGRADSPPVVTAVAVHPDGEKIAVGGDDHLVRVLRLDGGSPLHVLAGHTDWVRSVAFHPQGHLLVSGGGDRQILFWDVPSGRQLASPARHPQAVYAVRFSPDGEQLAAAGFDDKLRLYDTKTRRLRQELDCPCRDIRVLEYSTDGQLLCAGGRNGKLRTWEVATGKQQWNKPVHERRIRAAAFSTDDALLLSAGEGQMIRALNAHSGDEAFTLNCRPAKVLTMVMCGPGRLATAGTDNVIHIWDLRGRRELAQLVGHTGSVAALAYHAGTQTLVSGSYDTTVRVWRLTGLDADREASLRSPKLPATQ